MTMPAPMLLRMMVTATMPTTIVTPEPDIIVAEIDVAAPASRVFQALTDPADLMCWFKGGDSCPAKLWQMDARKGGAYSYSTKKGDLAINGVDELDCRGEILEFDPPRLLVYTWIANWHRDKKKPTTVRWELTTTGSGTHVKVTHSGLAFDPESRKDYGGGWPGVLGNLKQFVETKTGEL
ncbi:MAG TPA: SRPBCC domain-containing protein [Terriglobales bacterium]|nr:SRPBCC domain-containing protein [Terriglobales bacterium]